MVSQWGCELLEWSGEAQQACRNANVRSAKTPAPSIASRLDHTSAALSLSPHYYPHPAMSLLHLAARRPLAAFCGAPARAFSTSCARNQESTDSTIGTPCIPSGRAVAQPPINPAVRTLQRSYALRRSPESSGQPQGRLRSLVAIASPQSSSTRLRRPFVEPCLHEEHDTRAPAQPDVCQRGPRVRFSPRRP